MSNLLPQQIEELSNSIALHSSGATGGTGHFSDFNIGKEEGLESRIKELISNPNTQFMINSSNQEGRAGTVIFFNEDTKSFLIFNPNNLSDPLYDDSGKIISGAKGLDNLAGTFYREPKLNSDGVPELTGQRFDDLNEQLRSAEQPLESESGGPDKITVKLTEYSTYLLRSILLGAFSLDDENFILGDRYITEDETEDLYDRFLLIPAGLRPEEERASLEKSHGAEIPRFKYM